MNKKLTEEEVSEVLEELKGNILIVEGKKDEKALKSLGMRHIVRINSRTIANVAQDAVSLAEKHKKREVIVLTDFDRKGRKLASKLRLFLQRYRIHANSRIRRDVMNLGIRCIEEMASISGAAPLSDEQNGRLKVRSAFCPELGSGIAKSKECDDYGEISANFNKIRDKGTHKGKRCDRKAGRDRSDIRAD